VRPMTQYQPPADLSANAKRFWLDLTREHEIVEAHRLAILEEACRALDRSATARKLIAKDGMIIKTRTTEKAHPALMAEAIARADFLRCVRALKLDRKAEPRHNKFRVLSFPSRDGDVA
jgi:phage terminase small subunit